jgi:protein SCO1/2
MPGSRMLAAAAVAVLAAVTTGCANGGITTRTHDDSPGLVLIRPGNYKGNIITPVAKPTKVLTDTAGKPFDIRTMTPGGVTLLFFGYTHCPDECPLTMTSTAAAMRMLPEPEQAKIRVLFVTVDPARDTPARLRSWLGGFNPAFTGLRGTVAQVQAAARQVGIPVSSVLLEHGTEMLAYGTDGLAREAFFPSTPPADIAHDLALLVTGHQP